MSALDQEFWAKMSIIPRGPIWKDPSPDVPGSHTDWTENHHESLVPTAGRVLKAPSTDAPGYIERHDRLWQDREDFASRMAQQSFEASQRSSPVWIEPENHHESLIPESKYWGVGKSQFRRLGFLGGDGNDGSR